MNGLVSSAGDEPVWERPWSLEEIRKSCHSWSLGADAGLLNFLKEFSQQTISRTHEIEKQLDGLVREVKTTDCRLHNVFNDFLMLSNTQFIENRVYDEEVEEHIVKPEQGEKPEQEKTREQKEAELIPKIQEAVNYGLQVLETAFEQLDIKAGNSDSEDEEVNERVDLILEPKDLYIDRPLPYLIGSQLFMQQEDVGLGDLSSEEGSVDNDRGSVIDSEEEEDDDDDDEEEKDNDEESEEDFGNNSEDDKKLRTALSDEDEDNGSDLFGESDKEDEEENDKSSKTRTKSFADELAARIQAEIPKRPEADESSISSSEVKIRKEKEKKEVKKLPSDDEDDDMFKPPRLTDEDFFGNKGGLFSGGKGLFDDDDDVEGDLFSDFHTKEHKPAEVAPVARPETIPSDVKKKPPYGGVSLFPGGENLINPSILADKEKRKPATPTDVAPKPVPNTGLFDDDDVMFGGSAPVQPAAKTKPAAGLFADDDDLFNNHPPLPAATSNRNKVAADLDKKSIQMPTEKMQPPEPSIKRHAKGLFSDEDDSESDLFSPIQTASKPKAATSATPPANKTSKALSLFDDEEEDLFGASPESKPMPAAKPAPQPVLPTAAKTPKSSLFSSDEEEQIKVPPPNNKPMEKIKTEESAPPKSEKKSSLFEDEDDLFAITKDSQKKHHRVSLLFEEDENREESLFPSAGSSTKSTGQTLEQSKATAPKKETEKVLVVDGKPESKAPTPTVEDTVPPAVQKNDIVKPEADDLFADTPPTVKHTKAKSTNVLSLFGEEDDEDLEDQFPTSSVLKASEKISTEKSTQAKSTRVFQDEELLFSQELQKDNDPDVDLFASTSKKATEKPSSDKPSGGLGLFGEEDEDDLFSTAKPKKPPVIIPPKVQEKKTIIRKDSLDPPKEPSNLNVKNEAVFKPEVAEKPTEPVPIKSKSLSSRIGKLQANLHINPAAMLPGAVPKLSGVRHAAPEADISDLPVAKSSRTSDVAIKSVEGVSFETPAQLDTLHSANKSRAKVGGKRRPPTRMGRQRASQDSGDTGDSSDPSPISPMYGASSEAALAQSNWQPDQEEPIPSMKLSLSENDVQSRIKPKAPVNPLTPDANDLFGSDLFGRGLLADTVTARQKEKLPVTEAPSQPREAGNKSASVFDADGSDDDLFKSGKEKHHKTIKPTSVLEDEPEDDLFGAQKPQKKVDILPVPPKDTKATADIFEDDLFAAEVVKPVKKPKEKKTAAEANLFDDNADIFADLTHTPKEKKSKKKVEAKSIFDDDMDDIFSTSVSSTAKKSKPKAKSSPSSETKPDTKVSNMFDDPLNVLGK